MVGFPELFRTWSKHYRAAVDGLRQPREGRIGAWYPYDFLAFIEVMMHLGRTATECVVDPKNKSYWEDLVTVHQDLFHFLSGANSGSMLVGHDKYERTRAQDAWMCLEALNAIGEFCGSILYCTNGGAHELRFFNITKSCTTQCSGIAHAILQELEDVAQTAGVLKMVCTKVPLGVMGRILTDHGFVQTDGDEHYVKFL